MLHLVMYQRETPHILKSLRAIDETQIIRQELDLEEVNLLSHQVILILLSEGFLFLTESGT